MARLVDENKNGIVAITEKDRSDAYNRLKPLTEKACKEIERALSAVIPCRYCVGGNVKMPGPKGKCVMCAGLGMLADHDQRKWGAMEILNRVAPAPKAIEMRLDDSREKEKLIEEYEGKSPAEIKAALQAIRKTIPLQIANGDID
jgi:hypothetical protein